MALIENLQREDLTPIEEAAGYVRLSREFSMKQDEIAGRVGKSRASVANAMRLLDLHEDVQLLVAQSRLSVGHAKVILSLKDHPSQLLAADQILKRALTVRAAEKLIQSFHRESEQPRGAGESGASPVASPASQTDIMVRSIEAKLRDHFATHVTVHHGGKKGRIELEYYGNVDLQRLLDLLGLPNDEY
jgi:ParB family chromosome partitioning protein